ncbi:MAG TPA: hypothetical protein VFC82_09020 [Actinomycetaceae bacterium]|nr:hypothetical protein [Actinomycetaceae bacterium]
MATPRAPLDLRDLSTEAIRDVVVGILEACARFEQALEMYEE